MHTVKLLRVKQNHSDKTHNDIMINAMLRQKIGQDFDHGQRSPYRQLRASECHNFLDGQVDLMPIVIIYNEYWKHVLAIQF